MLAVRPFNVKLVIAPEDDVLVSKLPVEIVSVVPTGFVFNPRFTVADVLYITKLKSSGITDNVYVDAATYT